METKKLSLQEMEMVEGGSSAGCKVSAGVLIISSAVAVGFLVAAPAAIGVASLLAGQAVGFGGMIAGCLID